MVRKYGSLDTKNLKHLDDMILKQLIFLIDLWFVSRVNSKLSIDWVDILSNVNGWISLKKYLLTCVDESKFDLVFMNK